jgi:uncharacterized protein
MDGVVLPPYPQSLRAGIRRLARHCANNAVIPPKAPRLAPAVLRRSTAGLPVDVDAPDRQRNLQRRCPAPTLTGRAGCTVARRTAGRPHLRSFPAPGISCNVHYTNSVGAGYCAATCAVAQRDPQNNDREGWRLVERMLSKLVVSVLTASLLGACSSSDQRMRLATGPQGGSWYPLGGAVKNIVEKNMAGISVQVVPGAGIANVKAVESGQAQLAFANSVSTVDGINGEPPFDARATHICHVATFYPQYFQIVTVAGSGIRTPADFRGKALAAQTRGNTAEAITRHLLKVYGMSYSDLSRVNYGSYTDSVTLLKDDNAQVFTLGTSVPAGAVMDLASGRDIELLDVPDEALEKMRSINRGYRRAVIPAGTYPKQARDVATIGYTTHLIARCELDDNFIYGLLHHIHANLEDLSAVSKPLRRATPESMGEDVGVPLHPGAARWYRDKGVSVAPVAGA